MKYFLPLSFWSLHQFPWNFYLKCIYTLLQIHHHPEADLHADLLSSPQNSLQHHPLHGKWLDLYTKASQLARIFAHTELKKLWTFSILCHYYHYHYNKIDYVESRNLLFFNSSKSGDFGLVFQDFLYKLEVFFWHSRSNNIKSLSFL